MAHALTLANAELPHPANVKVPSRLAHRSRAERKAVGKALQENCPRGSHAEWKPPRDRPDPVRLVLKAN